MTNVQEQVAAQQQALRQLQSILEAQQSSAIHRDSVTSSIDIIVRPLESERSRERHEGVILVLLVEDVVVVLVVVVVAAVVVAVVVVLCEPSGGMCMSTNRWHELA